MSWIQSFVRAWADWWVGSLPPVWVESDSVEEIRSLFERHGARLEDENV